MRMPATTALLRLAQCGLKPVTQEPWAPDNEACQRTSDDIRSFYEWDRPEYPTTYKALTNKALGS